jgi:hypothetical protein
MSVQLFKTIIPKKKIYDLLENICIKNDKNFILNKDAFKKGIFNKTIVAFLEECKPYYHLSKQKYLEKKLTYNSFTTVVRQICNSNKIIYTSKINYMNSSYDIIYYIYKE